MSILGAITAVVALPAAVGTAVVELGPRHPKPDLLPHGLIKDGEHLIAHTWGAAL